MGCHGAPRTGANRPAHLLVMDTNTTLSGLEQLLTIEALAEYPSGHARRNSVCCSVLI